MDYSPLQGGTILGGYALGGRRLIGLSRRPAGSGVKAPTKKQLVTAAAHDRSLTKTELAHMVPAHKLKKALGKRA